MIDQIRADGLLAAARPVLVMLSGGRDSNCLIDLAVRIAGRGHVSAMHVTDGLRDAADADERHCAELCAQLGVRLEVQRPAPPGALNSTGRVLDDVIGHLPSRGLPSGSTTRPTTASPPDSNRTQYGCLWDCIHGQRHRRMAGAAVQPQTAAYSAPQSRRRAR